MSSGTSSGSSALNNIGLEKLVLKLSNTVTTLCERVDKLESELESYASTDEQLENEMNQTMEIAIEENSDTIWTTLWLASVKERDAKIWSKALLQQTRNCATNTKKEAIGTRKTIRAILQVMKRFDHSEEIESDCCFILKEFAGINAKVCENFKDTGCLSHLCEIFKKYWPLRNEKPEILMAVFRVYKGMAGYTTTSYCIAEDRFLNLFFMPLESNEFTEIDILSVKMFVGLLEYADDQWKCKLSKNEIDNRVFKGMDKWQIGKYKTEGYFTFYGFWEYLENGRRSVKRFAAWSIANHLEFYPEMSRAIFKRDGSSNLETILGAARFDLEVKEIILHILKKLKN